MADYYPLIAKAISSLDPDAPGETRRALYERARAALISQLRSHDPELTESEITRERLSLEEAVRTVEGEAAKRARDHSRARRAAAEQDALELKAANELRAVLRPNESQTTQRRPVAPPVTIIPEQDLKQAIGFSPTRRGPLDLVLDPPRDPFDPEQMMLYQRIRSQLKQLKDAIPSQERVQIDPAIDEFLDQPENWHEVEFKKLLWLSGNSIRTLLTQHDAVKSDAEPHYSKLPPSVAEALRRPVQAWNVFLPTRGQSFTFSEGGGILSFPSWKLVISCFISEPVLKPSQLMIEIKKTRKNAVIRIAASTPLPFNNLFNF